MRSFHTINTRSYRAWGGSTILGRVIVLLLLFAMTGCEQDPQLSRLRALSAREYYPIALERAQQWRPGAYLSDIWVHVLSEEDITRPLRVTFGFESPDDELHSLLIFFNEDSDEPEVKHIDHRMPISVRNPINSEEWPVDSLDALTIALDNGGNEFLTKHDPETAQMVLFLEHRPTVPGARLKWRASFWDQGAGELIWIMIDPQTGEVFEVERQSIH